MQALHRVAPTSLMLCFEGCTASMMPAPSVGHIRA